MSLKSSWMVMAAMFLVQSTVLALPVDQNNSNLPINPADWLPMGKSDKSSSLWGFMNPKNISGLNGDIPFMPKLPDTQGGDSYGNYAKKVNHRSVSDADSQGPSSCNSSSNEVRYPDTQPYSGNKKGVAQDPTWTDGDDDPTNSTTSPVYHNGYDKKKTKPVDGTISDPTFTDDPSNNTNYPAKPKPSRAGDSYGNGKRVFKPANGSISDPTFTKEPSNDTIYPDNTCYSEQRSNKLPNGTISDPTYTEDRDNNTIPPLDDYYHKKKSTKAGTISDSEGRPGHTATGKPCTVPSSTEHDKFPNSDKDMSFLDGKEHCIPDVNHNSEKNHDDTNQSHPYKFGNGNGDNTDKQI